MQLQPIFGQLLSIRHASVVFAYCLAFLSSCDGCEPFFG